MDRCETSEAAHAQAHDGPSLYMIIWHDWHARITTGMVVVVVVVVYALSS